jgi:hypothetical protein
VAGSKNGANNSRARIARKIDLRSCIALLSSVREILLAQWERPSTPIQTERVEIAHLAIFERRPFGRHRENRLLLPVHDLPLMLLLGDPGADRIEYQSAEPGA